MNGKICYNFLILIFILDVKNHAIVAIMAKNVKKFVTVKTEQHVIQLVVNVNAHLVGVGVDAIDVCCFK